MYLREALQQCHDLEEEVGHIYEELAALHRDDPRTAKLWTDLAKDERMHARVLSCLIAAQETQEDDGPFLVDVPQRIAQMRRSLDRAYADVRSGIDIDSSLEVATALEGSELNDVFEHLVELARPALHRLVDLIEAGITTDDAHPARIRQERAKRKNRRGSRTRSPSSASNTPAVK